MDDDGMRERLERLKNRMLARLAVSARLETAVSGLTISRYDSEVSAEKCFYNPIVAMVVQGQKHSLVGDRPIDCDEGDGMIVGVDMPGVFHITRASSQCPFTFTVCEAGQAHGHSTDHRYAVHDGYGYRVTESGCRFQSDGGFAGCFCAPFGFAGHTGTDTGSGADDFA